MPVGDLQLARALLDLALESGVGLPQLLRHVVELARERLELVAGPDLDSLVELAGGESARRPPGSPGSASPCGARRTGSRRPRAPGRRAAAARCARARRTAARTPRRAAARRSTCQPSGGMLAYAVEHLLALEVARYRVTRRVLAASRLARGLHLRQRRQVGLLQHQADVGMGDQAGRSNRRRRRAPCSDLDARDHVPDELEIDLRHGDPGLLADARRPRSSCRARFPCGSTPG